MQNAVGYHRNSQLCAGRVPPERARPDMGGNSERGYIMTNQKQEAEIVPVEQVQLGTIAAKGPQDVVAQATAISTTLAAVIDKRRLYSTIQRKRYVRVEGWTTLGAMLGVLPREVDVVQDGEGGYTATVELIRATDGQVIGRGSAAVGMDEPTWAKRPGYARRSMAVTRATGKAFRLGFSWIMTLAGYEVTPAEEMPQIVEHNSSKEPDEKTRNRNYFRALFKECERQGISTKELATIADDATNEDIVAAGHKNRALLDAVTKQPELT